MFRSYIFTWRQLGIFKLALLSIGAAIGAYWSDFFGSILGFLIIIALISGLYMVYVVLRQ
ncbi:MAG: hypothetical protein GYA69_05575 [Candidatus Moranbacteria bacterium]|nr:hypothetical protein [Candidatus Moranbacteria bacterium]